MAIGDANVEKSMDEILAQVQREYAHEGKAAQAAAPRQHSAEVVKIKPADDSGEAQPLIGPAIRSSDGAANALAQLTEIYKARRRANEFPMGGAARTLEDVMREMLQPMLQNWLDAKLPGIVGRLIAAELSRVIGDAISA
jgi:hypothetical protein